MKIVSYNILAQRFNRSDDAEPLDIRTSQIINNLLSEDPCVICLQEVELCDFEKDFKDIIVEYDYFSHVVSKKRRSPIGNVILWKKCYEKVKTLNTFASVLVSLKVKDKELLIANVHLKAGMLSGEKERLSQMPSVLKHDPDIICGDFNDTMSEERALYGLIKDKYKALTPGLTGYVKGSCNDSTGMPYWPFDHFIYKETSLKTANVLPTDLSCPIPNKLQPSDHLMVVFNCEF